MAFSSNLVKEWYKDKSVKELEEMYEDLKSYFCFESVENQIKYILDNFMDASYDTNLDSTREGIEELLKEKTGKEYTIQEKYFEIHLNDLIDYISKNTNLLSDKAILVDFFNKLTDVSEENKLSFLFCIIQSDKNFNEFINEIDINQEAEIVFEKYLAIADNFYDMNHTKG